MKKVIFKGCATALVTPFLDGEIDYKALDRLIDMQILDGIHALVIGGTTGEAATLTDTERYSLFEAATEATDGRVPLIFGTGTNDTTVALRHTKMAKRLGADAALVVTPYYNKGTEDGIYYHYMKIAESTDLPIILYNVPQRTGVNLSYSLLERLAKCENIVGIKEASDSADRLSHVAALGDELPLFAGNDSATLTAIALGGRGVISVASNLRPSLMASLAELALDGKYEAARALQFELLPLIDALFLETNPSPVKYAMSLLGLTSSEVRLPLSLPSAPTRARLESLLQG